MAVSWKDLDTRYKRVFSEGLWVAAGQILRAAGMLAGIRMLTSFVAPNVYGKLSLLIGALVFVTRVFCHPFLHSVHRFYHEARKSNCIPVLRKEIQRLLTRSTCVLAVFVIAAGLFCARIYQTATFGTVLLMAGLLAADIFSGYHIVFLTASRRQARYSSWVAIESWLKPCAALILIWLWKPSVDAILLGYLVGSGLTILLFYRPPDRDEYAHHCGNFSNQSSLRKQIIAYAAPLFPLAVVSWISSLGDRYIIGGMLDYHAVGVYAAAYGLALQPFQLAGGIVELTLRPIYFKAASDRQHAREKMAFRNWLVATIVISAIGFELLYLSSDWIADLLLGQKFRQASELIPWLAAGGALMAIGQVFEKPFYAHLQTRYVFFIQFVGAVASIVLCWLLVYTHGIRGAAAAVPLYYGFQCLVALYLKSKIKVAGRTCE